MKHCRLKLSFFFLLLASLVTLSSCQYKFGHGKLSEKYASMEIPHVKGDKEGKLTAELIRQLLQSGAFKYHHRNGEVTLNVEILDYRNENVGFQFDRDSGNNVVDRLLPIEGRVGVLTRVTLIETNSGKKLLGPKNFSAEVDYDYDPDITGQNITSFSLGQLNSSGAGRDVAQGPLGKALAEKIIHYVSNS